MEVEAEVFPLLFERICLVIIYIYIYKVDAPGGNPEVGNPEGNLSLTDSLTDFLILTLQSDPRDL